MRTASDRREEFTLSVAYTAEQAVVRIQGSIDLLTAPELASILTAVMARGHLTVVIELSELQFMDATGLRVIADAAARAVSTGGVLVLESAPPFIQRILAITGLDHLIQRSASEVAPELLLA